MKKYLESYEDLYDWITEIKPSRKKILYTENEEEESEYTFKKMFFEGNEIVLYESYYGGVGLLQDCCGMYGFDDLVSGLWDDLTGDDDNKVFIKTK